MECITAKQAAEKWHVTPRRVQALCAEQRIEGAKRMGKMWIIPQNARKPGRNNEKK